MGLEAHLGSDVLSMKRDALAVTLFQEEEIARTLKSLLRNSRGQVTQRSTAIGTGRRANQHCIVNVGRHDPDVEALESVLSLEAPRDSQAVGLLSGRTPGTPDMHCVRIPSVRHGGQFGKYFVGNLLEHMPVPPEPRYRNPAHGIQSRPLVSVRFEIGSIIRDIAKPQRTNPPCNAFADGLPHFPEPSPTHPKPWQAPLEKGGAVPVFHQ